MKSMMVIITSFVLLTATGAFADLALFGNIDFSGTASTSGSEQDVKMGWALGADFYKPLGKIFQLGGGLQYQFTREVSGGGSSKFGFIPIYGAARLVIPLVVLKPYAVGRIGYNFLTGNDEFKSGGDLKGGFYYGFGAGVFLFKILLVEGTYNVNGGSVGSTDFDYSKFSLSAGVNLGIGK